MAEELENKDSELQASEPQTDQRIEIEEAAADGKIESTEVVESQSEKGSQQEANTTEEAQDDVHMEWYILKVQTNREDSISKSIQRYARIAGLDKYFGQIVVPTETVTEVKGGKRKVKKQKLYPGYVVIQMEINQDTWYLVRQTNGVGDFAGSRDKSNRPLPMLPEEVEKILALTQEKATEETPTLKINFKVDDNVKVIEGNFESYEGKVSSIDATSGRVTVMINIFGRSTPVELEYWQIELLSSDMGAVSTKKDKKDR